ncbi:MAG: hypothetical protein WBB31_08315 [Saprospiraceae bacterium]
MKGKHYFLPVMILAGMFLPLSPLGAFHSRKPINLEDIRSGVIELRHVDKKEGKNHRPERKKMDGLSLTSYIATTVGLASLFLLPAIGAVLIPLGTILGLFGWTNKKRYEHRRGRGLAIASSAVGGAFAFLIAISFIAFFLTGGF